jgi:hypothetical protein
MSVIPVGETGTLAVAVSKSRNSPYAGHGEYGELCRLWWLRRGYGHGERQPIGLAVLVAGRGAALFGSGWIGARRAPAKRRAGRARLQTNDEPGGRDLAR